MDRTVIGKVAVFAFAIVSMAAGWMLVSADLAGAWTVLNVLFAVGILSWIAVEYRYGVLRSRA